MKRTLAAIFTSRRGGINVFGLCVQKPRGDLKGNFPTGLGSIDSASDEILWSGTFNTSSRWKTASFTAKMDFEVE